MSMRQDILQQALGLPPEDRAIVVAALQQSLTEDEAAAPPHALAPDDPESLQGAEFLQELHRRSASFHAGRTTARAADDVLADQRQRQAREASK